MVYLTAEDINEELKICSAYQYIEEIDNSISEEEESFNLLEEIIALQVGRYLSFNTGGQRPFDQIIHDTLNRMCYDKIREFERISNKKYIDLNSVY